jgi:hypothetical protein
MKKMREEKDERKDETLTTAELASIEGGNDDRREAQRDPRQARGGDGGSLQPLLPSDVTQKFRARWDELQIKFVDDTRNSVAQADQLVAELMKSLAGTFASEREGLENQWTKGENISTEDLRIALRRYRSFFERFLAV